MNNESNNGVFSVDNSSYTCPRCGNLVKISSRYCMKCGQVNMNHPDNQNFIRESNSNQNFQTYIVGKGNFMEKSMNQNDSSFLTLQATNTGNIKLCFYFNYFLYWIIIIVGSILSILGKELSFEMVLSSNIPMIWMITSFAFLYSYSFQRLFIKSNQKWWYFFIPIYNIMILSDIAFHKKNLGLLSFIPIIGEIYLLIVFYSIGKKFRYSGILTLLLFPIVVLFIAFSNHYYEGRIFVDSNNSLEREYSRRKIFLVTIFLFLILGGGMFLYSYFTDLENISMNVDDYYYVRAAKKIVEKTKEKANKDLNSIECNNVHYGIPGTTYLFYFSDTSKEVYLPFSLSREVITSSVFVTFFENGETQYEVAVSDGEKEIRKVKIEDLNSNSVISTDNNSLLNMKYPNMCHFQ